MEATLTHPSHTCANCGLAVEGEGLILWVNAFAYKFCNEKCATAWWAYYDLVLA